MNNNSAELTESLLLPEVVTLRMSNQSLINYNYLIIDAETRNAVIVDPAWELDVIEEALYNASASLKGILLTHAHLDHVHLAKPLSQRYLCPIWMSEKEIAVSGYRAPGLISLQEKPLSIGQMQIQPILTPGHTAGCVCYLIGDNLFTGDVLFAEGCGICPNTEAAYQMFDSLEKIKKSISGHTRVFPGHSYGKQPGRLFSQILRENMYLQFKTRESFAAFRLRGGQKQAKLFNFQ